MNIIRIQGEAERRQGIYYEYDRDGVLLGEGGMGRIFQGFRVDELSGGFRVPVAIKEIHENIARDPQLIERAMREASIQIDHENLLRMYGFVASVEYDPMRGINIMRHYMVMERLVGVNLDQILNGTVKDRSGMFIPYAQELYDLYSYNRVEAIVRIMKGVMSGIMALHEKGFIHRDIDPSNVMITIDNKIKLIDFGVCKRVSNSMSHEKLLTQAGSFIGKVNYAAPELALGDVQHQDRRTDIYALGVLIYQLAVGRLPFVGTNQEVLAAHISKRMPVNDIPNRDLRRIVEKATQKKQEKRFASAAEFMVALEHISQTRQSVDDSKRMTANSSMNYDDNNSVVLWLVAVFGGLIFGLILNFITI
ncbi:MAG: serine/threonine protein kinase [Alistipes sp.]|nr:serine/threonine protein kinase [Alistipes sp.]